MIFKQKYYWKFYLLFAGLGLSFVIGNLFGGSDLGISESIQSLFQPGSSGLAGDIIWKIRFPRVVLGIVIGAGLASCGAVFQGLLRNPLAEPYTLGVSGGAALGVAIGTVLHLSVSLIPVFAFAGSLLSIFLVYSIASRKRFSNSILILVGVIFSFLFSSFVFFIFSMAKPEDVHGVVMWLMGDLSSSSIEMVYIVLAFIIPGLIVLFFFLEDLNILTLGDEKASHLGVNPKHVKKIIFFVASLITGACVSASGIIGFVGLIIPHFIRKIIGANHKLLIPASCLAGAIFLSLCDALSRVIMRPLELPVGVITGIFGGVFFLGFLLKSKRWEIQ
jgi:iron complex transport system permease protein